VWRPFQLSPDMPREGRNRLEHYQQIFGAERAGQIMRNMQVTGGEEGIPFGSSPDAMSPNTLAAHTLLLWAEESPDVDADALAEALFHAHHVQCADLGDHEVLVEIAEGAGMDGGEVRRRLQASADEERVQAAIRESQARGVSGVPFFIIDGKYGLSGAQPPEVLVNAFRQITDG
ncbi:MAG: DsbA family oxidoreductase, partial [Gammaproteobacteria bacterium]|nr:DsbA family oxidoreductase [Gammaproteobacteria bacterium]